MNPSPTDLLLDLRQLFLVSQDLRLGERHQMLRVEKDYLTQALN